MHPHPKVGVVAAGTRVGRRGLWFEEFCLKELAKVQDTRLIRLDTFTPLTTLFSPYGRVKPSSCG